MEKFSTYRGPSLSCWNRNKKDKQQILTDKDLIQQNLINILLTSVKERIYNISFGCNLLKILFSFVSNELASDLKTLIIKNLKMYEPRIEEIDVKVTPEFPSKSFLRAGYKIEVIYSISFGIKVEYGSFIYSINLSNLISKTSPFI